MANTQNIHTHDFNDGITLSFQKSAVTPHTLSATLHVPDGVQRDEPIELHTLIQQAGMLAEELLIVVGVGARVAFVDNVRIGAEERVHRAVTMQIQKGAQVELLANYQLKNGICEAPYTFMCEADAYLGFFSRLFVENGTIHSTPRVFLQGAGAQARLHGYYVGKNSAHISLNTDQIHTAPHTRSSLIMHGLLAQLSGAHYCGTITVNENAYQTESEQTNKNRLMDKTATATSIPNLQVKTDDVQCRHGSAVGQYDPDILLYMHSRGLSQARAYGMLHQSFLAQTTIALPKWMVNQVRDFIAQDINQIREG